MYFTTNKKMELKRQPSFIFSATENAGRPLQWLTAAIPEAAVKSAPSGRFSTKLELCCLHVILTSLHLEVHDIAEGAGRGSLCEWGSPVNHLVGDHSHRPPVTFQPVGTSSVLIHHGQYFGSHVVGGPNGEFGIHLETQKWKEHCTLNNPPVGANTCLRRQPICHWLPSTQALKTFCRVARYQEMPMLYKLLKWARMGIIQPTWVKINVLVQVTDTTVLLASTKGLNPGPYK